MIVSILILYLEYYSFQVELTQIMRKNDQKLPIPSREHQPHNVIISITYLFITHPISDQSTSLDILLYPPIKH
jgi:hypothetical protein